MTDRRLIEVAFPLEQTSLDSVHEKNVRHGHISTLHIWPARRPLAACRAALIAALLPDPGTPETRRALCERIGGRVEKVIEKKRGPGARGEEKVVKKTVGGILHWGRETENKADLEFFRQEIRKAFGGRAPRVLDPFAGGGAIPLEAMRLGCNVTAMDINPVAWFILKCTLEYPQRLAGQTRPLPEFVREDRVFMEQFLKAQGFKGAMLRSQLRKLGLDGSPARASKQGSLKDAETGRDLELEVDEHTLEADLAWHVRAWGWWVLHEARRRLARYYPVYADFEPLKGVGEWRRTHPEGARPMTLVPLRDDGTPDVDSLKRRVHRRLPRGRPEAPLGRQTDRRLPVGAHRCVQELPRDAPAAEDPVAREESEQAGTARDGAKRRANGCCVLRRRQRAGRGREQRAAPRARPAVGSGDDEPIRCVVSLLWQAGHGCHEVSRFARLGSQQPNGRPDDSGRCRHAAW